MSEVVTKKGARNDTIPFLLGWLSRFFATASALNLVYHGIHFGLSETLHLILVYYDKLKQFCLGPLDPAMLLLFHFIKSKLHIDLHLSPHWKDVMVLLLTYFGARQRSMWIAGNNVSAGFRLTMLAVSILAAFAGSAGAGTIALQDGLAGPARGQNGLLIAVFPLVAALFFDIAENVMSAAFRREEIAKAMRDPEASKLGAFAFLARKSATRFVVASLLLLAAAPLLPLIPGLPNPGVAALGILLVITSIYWLDQGRRTVRTRINPGESWWHCFWRIGSTRNGVEIAFIIAAVMFFIMLNAGLAPFGL